MSEITIEVPAERREDVLRELIGLYAVGAESLFRAADDYLRGDGPIAALLHYRDQLTAIAGLIDQLGWELGRPPATGELRAEDELLALMARGALAAAADELRDVVEAVSSRATESEAIAPELRRVSELFELLQKVEAAASGRSCAGTRTRQP